MIWALVYGYIPYFILPLYASLDRIDRSYLEAARDLGASPFRTFLHVTLPLSKTGLLGGAVLIALPMFGDYYTPNIVSGAPTTSMIGNQIDLYFHGGPQPTIGAAITILLSAVPADPDGLLPVDDPQGDQGAAVGMTESAVSAPQSKPSFSLWQRVAGWVVNPWGKPRFLVLITWVYMLWAIVPVIIAIQFSFNDSRSRTVWQGFSTRGTGATRSLRVARPGAPRRPGPQPHAGRLGRGHRRRRSASPWRSAWPAGGRAAPGARTS